MELIALKNNVAANDYFVREFIEGLQRVIRNKNLSV
jgi:hypothetical protein